MESENNQGKSLLNSQEDYHGSNQGASDINNKENTQATKWEDLQECEQDESRERNCEESRRQGNSLMNNQENHNNDDHENFTHKRQRDISTSKKLLRIPLLLLFAVIAVILGIQAGNLIYSMDTAMIQGVDVQNYKNMINSSIPIIDTVYNSGKSSVSFSREIKSLFSKVFAFDITSPMTILNVQSPIFKSYYDHSYKSMLADGNPGESTDKGSSIADSGNANKNGDNAVGSGTINKDGTGANENNLQSGTDSDSVDGGSGTSGDNEAGERNEQIGESGNSSGNNGHNDASAQNSTILTEPQPISSIAYEEEEENEDDSSLVAIDKMVIKNFTKYDIEIAALLKEPIDFNYSKKGPKVLIYHTHTSESYVLKESDLDNKAAPSFNSDPKYNVVRVGEELARNLKKYGIETLHNGTVHDKIRNAAYGESIKTLQSYVKSYPSIKVYIDIHRDAVDSSKPKLRSVTKINGKNAAQIMFVMGSDIMLPNPHWKENLKFALKVQQKLNEKYPGLAKPLMLVSKRYNQQISDQAVLIEVGGDGNLLSECLESMKYLAEALNDVMKGE